MTGNKTDRPVKFPVPFYTEPSPPVSNSHLGQGQSKHLSFTFLHNVTFYATNTSSHTREEANSSARNKFPLF